MNLLKTALAAVAWVITVGMVAVSAQVGVDSFFGNWRWVGALLCLLTTLYFANRLRGQEAILGGHAVDAHTGPIGKLSSDVIGAILYATGVWIMFFR